MNHKEHYEFLSSQGIMTPDIEDIITSLVNRLIENLYKPDLELQFKVDANRIKEFEIDGEPINWGSLSVNEVYRYNDGYKVVIDEAAPKACPSFCEYIEKFMKAWGWIIYVETEW